MVKLGEWSERVEAIRSGFTIEKGFRGEHFKNISVLKGKGRFKAGIRDTFPIVSEIEQESGFYPAFGTWMSQ